MSAHTISRVYPEVLMNEDIAEAGQIDPRDLGVRRLEGGAHPLHCLPDDLEVADGSILEDPVGQKGIPAAPADLLHPLQRLENVGDLGPVVLHRGRASARMRSASRG